MKDLFSETEDLQTSENKDIRVLPSLDNKTQDKNIKWFNQRIQQIQKLKIEKEELVITVAELKKQVDTAAHESIQELIAANKKLLDKAINRLDAKSLTKRDKADLNNIIVSTCSELEREYDADMSAYRKLAHEKLPEEEKREINASLKEFYNLDQDFEANDVYNLSKEEMQDKYGSDIFDKINESHQNFDPLEAIFGNFGMSDGRKNERKKTKKELEREKAKEELEQLSNKDFSQLYKSLSKRIHPDLEQDPEKKMIREELMKRLIAAKETRDLFDLLCIEFELNHAEENSNSSTTNNLIELARIKRFNDMLLEQRKALEADISNIKIFNPNTSFYFKNFYHKNPMVTAKNIKEYVESIRKEAHEVNLFSKDLDTIRGTKDFIEYQMMLKDQPFMDFIFGDEF